MTTQVAKTIPELQQLLQQAKRKNQSIGFVPTMGALHAGHSRLIHAARAENDFVVVSIFVNPSQFGPNEDFARYPRTFEADLALCEAIGTDVIFAPSAAEMYPPQYHTWVNVEKLGDHLCGASRPGHFRGVCTIVLKLLNVVQADAAYFGQKDLQQARILQQMAEDLHVPCKIHVCATVREADGLAMSSRNRFLTPMERHQAPVLYRTLQWAQAEVHRGERSANLLLETMRQKIQTVAEAKIDYLQIVDATELQPVDTIDANCYAALAVFFCQTRLIDNILLQPIEVA